MKLLVSAKDLKTSCYIYFIDTKKIAIITNVLRATKIVRGGPTRHFTTTRFERLRDFTDCFEP